MIRKLTVIFLIGLICFVGAGSALAVKYSEAPMLKTLVAAGELPPVEERLPEEPFVVEPFEEIGRYGGTANVFAVGSHAWNDWQHGTAYAGQGLFGFSIDGKSLQSDIAKGYKWDEDLKAFTIYLREGAKWSDGAPFTADDIVFQFEDIYGNDELTPVKPELWSPGEELLKAKKVDDYTVRLEFAKPYPRIESELRTYNSWQTVMYSPKHYLKRWHIKYNPKADELAKEEGYDSWVNAFKIHQQIYNQIEDLNLPRMAPWIMKAKAAGTILLERNPYYWKVDTEGNQLPYIDKVLITEVSEELYQIKAISGEADFAYTTLSLENYPLYKENEERGGYRVVLSAPIWSGGNMVAVGFNFNEKDPVLRKIYHDIRFRKALSWAIDRDDINESLFFGKATPWQVAPFPSDSYYKEEWGQYCIQYDPEKANRFLDEMGLDKRDAGGWRSRSDGKRLELTINFHEREASIVPIMELVKEYWEAVGVKTALNPMSLALFGELPSSSDRGLIADGQNWHTELMMYNRPGRDLGYGGNLAFFIDWWDYNGFYPESKNTRPEDQVTLEEVKKLRDLWMKWGSTRMGSKEYLRLAEQALDYVCYQLWSIGTVAFPDWPFIIKNNLRNVPSPEDICAGSVHGIQDYTDQFFFTP